jgi:hypothetical protein
MATQTTVITHVNISRFACHDGMMLIKKIIKEKWSNKFKPINSAIPNLSILRIETDVEIYNNLNFR